MNVALAEIRVGRRHRKDMGDLDALVESMRTLGLLQPIGITPEKELVFGQRRLKAARKLGWETIPARVIKVDKLLAEQDENEVRKEFTPSERVSIVEAIRAHIGNRAGRPGKNIPENSRELPKGVDTIEFAAVKGGFGNDFTYRQAKSVVDRGTPELVRAMDGGSLSINAASWLAELPYADQVEAVQMMAAGEASNARQAVRRLEERKRAAIPRPEHVDARVLHGDAVELVRGLEQRPHLVVTDPPYGLETHNTRRGGQDYADGEAYTFELLERLCEALAAAESLFPQSVLKRFCDLADLELKHQPAQREIALPAKRVALSNVQFDGSPRAHGLKPSLAKCTEPLVQPQSQTLQTNFFDVVDEPQRRASGERVRR